MCVDLVSERWQSFLFQIVEVDEETDEVEQETQEKEMRREEKRSRRRGVRKEEEV